MRRPRAEILLDRRHETGRTAEVDVHSRNVSGDERLDVETLRRIAIVVVKPNFFGFHTRTEIFKKRRVLGGSRAVMQNVIRALSLELWNHRHHSRDADTASKH